MHAHAQLELTMSVLTKRSYFVPSTKSPSTKPSSSFSQSRKSRKLDFENVIYLLDLEPEDSGYKLLSALTNNGKLSIVSFMSLSKSELKEIRVADANETTLAFDDWEVSEIFDIYSYFMHKRSETNEDFQLRDIEPGSFEDSKLSRTYFQMTRAREDMSRSSSTRDQPNSSRPSISPTHVDSTSSSSIEASPSITDESSPDSQLDSEHSLNTIAEESSTSSFESAQESNSIASSESNHDSQPTLHSIFHDAIESNDDPAERNKSIFLEPLKSEELFCDDLNMFPTKLTSPIKDSRKSYDFEVDFSFRYQLFEKDQAHISIQSSEIVGSMTEVQRSRLNRSTSSFCSSNRSYKTSSSHSHKSNRSSSIECAEDLRFSRTYLLNLESILLRSPNPTPKIKEALHMIKRDVNSHEDNDHHSRLSKQSQQVSNAGQALVASTLAANASSHSSLRPKRRAHKSPNNVQAHPPVKKLFSSPCFGTNRPCGHEKEHEKTKFSTSELSSPPSFPKILSTPPKESCEISSCRKTKSNAKKELNLKTIFSPSRKLSPKFKDALSRTDSSEASIDCDMPYDEAAIDCSFQQSTSSSNDVGRSPAATPNSTRHHPRVYGPSDVHSSNPPFASTAEFSFEDLETFENNMLAETSNLRDDFSHSSHSSNASTEFSSCIEIEDMIRNASKVLDQKRDEIHEILNFDSQDPSSFKSPPLSNEVTKEHAFDHVETTKDNSMAPTTPKKGISMNFVTPSPTSEDSARSSTSNQVANLSSCSSVASALATLTLVSNAASHSSFRPKRRSHHAPTNIPIYPLFKRESKPSCFASPGLPTPKKASTSRVECASTDSFSTSTNHSECLSSCSSSSLETVFMKRETSFEIKIRDFFHLHSSRFLSTRKVFKQHFDSKRSSCDSTSHHSFKEIKGPDKTLNSLHCKIIFEKTSGTHEAFSSSHLGTSIFSKSKVKATKHIKSSFKAKPTKSRSPSYSAYSTASRNRVLLLIRPDYGEQPLYLIIIVILIILLLLYLFVIKLLHRPFDRGKETFNFII